MNDNILTVFFTNVMILEVYGKKKMRVIWNEFFVLPGFSFPNTRDSQDSRGRMVISLSPPHFNPLHRHLDISQAIIAESSPLHIASSQT